MSTTLTAAAIPSQTIVQNSDPNNNNNNNHTQHHTNDSQHNIQHIAPNNVIIDNNMNNKSAQHVANNCSIQLNNLLTLPLNNGSPLYLFDHTILRNSSINNNNIATMTAINANSLHKIANNTNNRNNNTSNMRVNTNNMNSMRDGSTPSPLTLSAMSNNLNDSSSNAYSISKPSRPSDGLISGLNFSHSDILREGGFISYHQTSPATPTSTPSSFMTSSLDGYLTGGQGGPHSNQSFDLLDSDSFSEMPNSLSPSCQPTYDDNSGHSYGETKKQCNESTAAPTKKKRKNGPQVRPSCPDCGKEFSNQSALSKHKLTHSDERKFVCTQCAKAFKRQDHLNGHLLTHRSKKPYECDVEGCEKTYCDARSLRRHKENHHPGGVNTITSTTLPAVTIIPGIALNFSTNASNISIANSAINKIKYAPPPPQQPSVSASMAASSVSSAATQLKLLALQQDNVNTINTINTSGKWNHRSNDELSDKWNEHMDLDKNALRQNNGNECKIKHESAILAQDSHENALLHQLLTQQQYKDRQPLFTAQNALQMQSQQRSQSNLTQSQPQPHQSSSLAMVQSQQEWPYTMFAQSTSNKSEPQQVECSLCQRKFKNVPALNGHMRLHGGYLKNQSQNITNSAVNAKKENKVDNSQMKAIVDVIKERIFRKHANISAENVSHSHSQSSLPPLITHSTSSITMATTSPSHQQMAPSSVQQLHSPIQPSLAPPILSPVTPVTPIQSGVSTSFNYDFSSDQNNDAQYNRSDQEFNYSNELQLLREQLQFRIPSQPIASPNQNRFQHQDKQQSHSHSRRHSDSSDLIVNNNISNNVKVLDSDDYSSNDCYNTQFNDLLRRRTQRTCSDPGVEPVMTINTNYNSPQPQMYNQFYHQSHSVPTTPTALYHSASATLQPQSYPHSLPSTPTAPSAPVSFQHSPHSSQRTSLPSTPTDAQQHFNFISVPSPANVASVKSHYSASPSSVAQYSPSNTQYSPSPAATQQFTYTVQPPTTRTTVVYERRIQDNYQQSAMYDEISNYTNTVNVNSNSLNNEHFNFDNNMASTQNYYETANSIIANETNQMHISNQQIEQLSLNTLSPKPQSQQQFFDNYSTASHDYPIVTTSNYVQSTNCWQQTQIAPNRVELTIKDIVHNNANTTSTSLVSNANSSVPNVSMSSDSASYSVPNSTFMNVNTTVLQSTLSPITRNAHTLKSCSSPNLVVNLDKIDEVDEECDDVFLSPIGVAPSPKRTSPSIVSGVVSPKRAKHRPEPLYIPPHVNTCGYQSRLRSPRLWDPTAVADSKNLSPPPYTPPPMLSPVRSGPGLFWHIISGSMTPKSGTITPKFVYSRKSLSEKEKEKEENTSLIVNTTPTTAYEPFDCEIPETDIQPHVNIGPSFQARIPAFNNCREQVKYRSDKADLIWDPTIVEPLTDDDIESFLELSCCACVPGSGRNKEYAYHLLFMTKGDIHNAISKLLQPRPTINEGHPLVDYQYPENDFWVQKEIELYHNALSKCDKDFFSISKEVGTKSVKQCIQFYYMWKKVCPDEYRRLRTLRRKREQETIFYNLRSKEEENNNNSINAQTLKEETDFDADNNNDTEALGLVNNISGHSSDVDDNLSSLIDSANPSPATSVGSIAVAVVEYPCKLCGKVFHKVKSRSAHMKIHGSSGSAKY